MVTDQALATVVAKASGKILASAAEVSLAVAAAVKADQSAVIAAVVSAVRLGELIIPAEIVCSELAAQDLVESDLPESVVIRPTPASVVLAPGTVTAGADTGSALGNRT